MTRDEMIDNMASVLIDALDRETVDKFIEDDNGNLIGIETYSLYEVAKQLYNAGYRKVDTDGTKTIDLARELIEAQNKIERIEKEVAYWESETKIARRDIDEAVLEVRANAVHEFAEKLKKKFARIYHRTISDIDVDDINETIDELLKEYEE